MTRKKKKKKKKSTRVRVKAADGREKTYADADAWEQDLKKAEESDNWFIRFGADVAKRQGKTPPGWKPGKRRRSALSGSSFRGFSGDVATARSSKSSPKPSSVVTGAGDALEQKFKKLTGKKRGK